MLADVRETSGGLYGRFLRLDDAGNQGVVQLAQATGLNGPCGTCTGVSGNGTLGFRAAVIGTLVPDSGTPQLFETQMVLPYDEGCPENTIEIGPNEDDLTFEAGLAQGPMLTHGSLMLVSWGFILPLGVISARLLRHRLNAIWFKIHQILQPFGLIIALIGWSIALKNFNILGSGIRDKAYTHAVCGTTAMCLGLLQPFNAVVRPHSPKDGEEKGKWRVVWEVIHKGLGYVAIILAIVTVGLGTTLVGSYKSQFQAGYIAALVMLAFLAIIMIVDKIRYNRKEEEIERQSEGPNEHSTLNEAGQVE
jgi:protein-S-isoprenylcysteine O-methyltransferase Ste14